MTIRVHFGPVEHLVVTPNQAGEVELQGSVKLASTDDERLSIMGFGLYLTPGDAYDLSLQLGSLVDMLRRGGPAPTAKSPTERALEALTPYFDDELHDGNAIVQGVAAAIREAARLERERCAKIAEVCINPECGDAAGEIRRRA